MPDQPSANPQGKGNVPVLHDLAGLRAHAPPPKLLLQVEAELFTSLFILDSEFKFKPVSGMAYWLYHQLDRFRLSLIAPHEGIGDALGNAIGCCTLHPDLTWTLELTTSAATDTAFLAQLEQRRTALRERLAQAATLAEAMPGYERRLPYYQRALTSALGWSLRHSLHGSGIARLTYDAARDA